MSGSRWRRTRTSPPAGRLGIEFSEDFRLLADIGWRRCEPRESFELTMPVHDLMEVLKRLRAGELDGLVLNYLTGHKGDGPLTATAIGKGIERSAGAVANCLARLAKDGRVRQA